MRNSWAMNVKPGVVVIVTAKRDIGRRGGVSEMLTERRSQHWLQPHSGAVRRPCAVSLCLAGVMRPPPSNTCARHAVADGIFT